MVWLKCMEFGIMVWYRICNWMLYPLCFLTIMFCVTAGLPSCVGSSPQQNNSARCYPWQCLHCKTCSYCHKSGDKVRLILTRARFYHQTYSCRVLFTLNPFAVDYFHQFIIVTTVLAWVQYMVHTDVNETICLVLGTSKICVPVYRE